ncbi:MAG: DUF2231 domain-containing protein [Methylomonas sp.]|nr:DUF2231 domain-containing protein [Methylomonas sp.]PPD21237.1 MAG: hypothetical protein CTY23_06305 [Methylomonas sp.]PPD27655.1 MAG: hypothetical protein CTY22_01145 [Methylomonas sp.]PPD38211.1 MAG: hypothetical protein CTY17_09765 [Methylomonas sp.]PPD39641.1 MAG: hypothetical protein CTY21_01140 [Methylomonas sp.]
MIDLVQDLQFAVHGGGDSGDGIAGMVAGILTFVETLVTLSPADMVTRLLPGLATMRNLHPLWVHFPIALLSLFLLADVLGVALRKTEWRRFASGLLYLGTLFAGITVIAGLIAAGTVAHGGEVHEIMERHEHLGISVFSMALALSIWRWFGQVERAGRGNGLFLSLASILVALLLLTADLGGYMVYKFGVAVEAADAGNEAAAQQHLHEGDASPDQHPGVGHDHHP